MSSEALADPKTLQYEVLAENSGLRLIIHKDDGVAFIEIPEDVAFHVEDLYDLIKYAEDTAGYTVPPYGLLIEDAYLFDDGFDDRVILVRNLTGEAE